MHCFHSFAPGAISIGRQVILRGSGPLIWLKFASEFPAEARDMPSGVYAVNFTGRRSLFQGSYGHLGMYDEEVVVDHMISIRKIESPPKG